MFFFLVSAKTYNYVLSRFAPSKCNSMEQLLSYLSINVYIFVQRIVGIFCSTAPIHPPYDSWGCVLHAPLHLGISEAFLVNRRLHDYNNGVWMWSVTHMQNETYNKAQGRRTQAKMIRWFMVNQLTYYRRSCRNRRFLGQIRLRKKKCQFFMFLPVHWTMDWYILQAAYRWNRRSNISFFRAHLPRENQEKMNEFVIYVPETSCLSKKKQVASSGSLENSAREKTELCSRFIVQNFR